MKHATNDFHWDEAGTSCQFLYDEDAETLSIAPSEWKDLQGYKTADTACKRWGTRRCSSIKEANRIIQEFMPLAYVAGIHFHD